MLALAAVEKDIGPYGIPMSEATDPANQFAFTGADAPVIDWAARNISERQRAYYALWDTDKDNPMNRAGHLWGVEKKT